MDTCGTVISSFFTDLQKWRERAYVLFMSSAPFIGNIRIMNPFIPLNLNNVETGNFSQIQCHFKQKVGDNFMTLSTRQEGEECCYC